MHAYADPRSSARDRAFERLYRRYVQDVYRYTLALLRNPADAEDATQTTFLNAYRAYKRGEEPLKPQNWLIKIAHNACRTRYLRASRRPAEVPLEDSLRELAVPADEIPNVKEVLDALARLPFNQRSALVMRELEGRSYAEIAQALDVSVPAVETLIFRARRALRVRRSALRSLGALPLPVSLTSFSGGGAAVGGSAVIGSGLVLKAILAVGVGVVAGAAGTAVEAQIVRPDDVALPHKPPLTVEAGSVSGVSVPLRAAPVASVATKARAAVVAGKRVPRKDVAPAGLPRRERPGGSGAAGDVSPGSVAAPASTPAAGTPGSASSPSAAPVGTVTETVSRTVPTPPLPVVPVETPAVAVPALPAPEVPPVAPPALPPPPPLPPPPTLP